MTKAKLIAALAVACASLHASATFAADESKATETPAASTAAPALGKEADDTTLFTRVNGTYRKSEKQLLPRT
jgi:hypothetical protein